MQAQSIRGLIKMDPARPPVLDLTVAKPVVRVGTRNYYTFRQSMRLVPRKTQTTAPRPSPHPRLEQHSRFPRNHLYKTRYCSYGDSCLNPETCRFAHSELEIRSPNCMFGEECIKRATCRYKHPLETRKEYHDRITV